MPVESIIGGAVVTELGHSLFDYNRENFRFDAEMRFERFMASRELAITQMNMYRNDVRKMTELVVTKTNMYTMVGALILAVNIALFCAGRLGLHGQSPPGWIMGLFLTNNAASLAFLSVTIWMCMHASMRASAATAHLLTRKVRLPVPTKRQMDKARKLSSDFEKQTWGDIFRVPFVQGHWGSIPDPSAEDPRQPLSTNSRARSVPAAGRRGAKKAPGWAREEWETDRAGTVTGPTENLPKDCAPEHFRLYAKCMTDWWPFDVYARINLMIGVTCFIQALAYYGLGHINIELRAFWPAYSNPFLLAVAVGLLINFDIKSPSHRSKWIPDYVEYCGPLAVFPAAIAMSLEFRDGFDKTAITFAWIFIFIAHGLQIIYTLKLIDSVWPDQRGSHPRVSEKLGCTWWPEQWQIPSAFEHVLYLVAPPKRVQPGQHDLCRELKEGDNLDAGGSRKRVNAHEEVTGVIAYLDSVFEWWRSAEVSSMVSPQGQKQVSALFEEFVRVRQVHGKESPENMLLKLGDIRRGLEEVRCMESEPIAGSGAGDLSDSSTGSMSGPEGSYRQSAMDRGGDTRYRGYKTVEPWKLTIAMLCGLLFSWVLLVGGNFVEVFLGEQAFLTAPHWARPPMTRPSRTPWEHGKPLGGPLYAAGMQWLPEHMEWYEHTRCEGVEVGIGIEVFYHECKQTWRRRLQVEERALLLTWGSRNASATQKAPEATDGLADALKELLSVLPSPGEASGLLQRNATSGEAYQLLDALSKYTGKHHAMTEEHYTASRVGPSQPSKMLNISWPPHSFDPDMMVCGTGGAAGHDLVAAALTSAGEGAIFSMQDMKESQPVQSFHLTGLEEHASILGSSWSLDSGLLLVTRKGDIVECKGSHPNAGGQWPCSPLEGERGSVPAGAEERLLAAVASKSSAGVRVALVLESSPDLISIFELEGEGREAHWLSLGDIPLPGHEGSFAASKFSIAFAGHDELLVATSSGSAFRRRLSDGEYTRWDWGRPVAKHAGWHTGQKGSTAQWRAACGLMDSSQGVAHLTVRTSARAATSRPEILLVGEAAAASGQRREAEDDALVYYL